jgi:hypothetical protein
MNTKEKRKEAIEGNIFFIEKIINIYKDYKSEIESVYGLYGYDEKVHSKSKILIWKYNIHEIKLNFLSNLNKNIYYLNKFYYRTRKDFNEIYKNKIIIYINELEKLKIDIENSISKDKKINDFDLNSFNSIDLISLLSKIKKIDNNCLKMKFILSEIKLKYDQLFSYKFFFILNDYPNIYMQHFYSLLQIHKNLIFEPYLSEYMYLIDLNYNELINIDISHLK